jgi:dipeptidase E
MKIVAIGGGELADGETEAIDKYSLKLTKKKSPVVLFIPTASHDSESYFEIVKTYFVGLGAARVDAIYLLSKPDDSEVKKLIDGADLVYVGGGSTYLLMQEWERYNLRSKFEERYQDNSNFVLSGLSAGSNCWFEYCTTDSPELTGGGGIARMRCLGFIKGIGSPHHVSEKLERENTLPKALIALEDRVNRAIAIDDGAAFVHIDGEEFYINSIKRRKVRVLNVDSPTQYKEEIERRNI